MIIPGFFRRVLATLFGSEVSGVRRPAAYVASPASDEQPQLLGLDVDPKFDDLYEAGLPDAYRARLASMRPFVLEVFLRTTVDKQPIVQIALELGLSQRTARRLLREAVRIISTSAE